MATYYVDFVNGLDANNGLGPDASHATNKPWKTIAKLLGAAGMASGDTAYLSPAGPFREVVTVAMTSAVAETKVIGDVANVQGFKTSGGVLVAPGQVVWTAFTTNDKTAPSGSSVLNLAGRDFLTFQRIMFVPGTAIAITAGTATSINITFEDCLFNALHANSGVLTVTSGAGVALNWVLRRCSFYAITTIINILLGRHTVDYDANFLIENCFLLTTNNQPIFITSTGSGVGFGGGVDVVNCTSIGVYGVYAGSASLSTTIPCTVTNSFISASVTAIFATTSGQITEDWNLLKAPTARTNVTAGGNSQTVYAPLIHLGGPDDFIVGRRLRPFGEPWPASPLLGFGSTSPPAVDIRNAPRPAGGGNALASVGAFDRGNTFGRETGTVRTGSNAISITGPGYQDFTARVDAAATTITAYVRWDATYAGTKPKMLVLGGTECGVADATATATGSSGAWELLTLNFTPTAKSVVKIRFLSSDTNGGGKMFVDDLLAEQ